MLEKNKKYFDRVLSKLKLAFSESEVVKLLTKKLSETEIELGKVISEKDELQHHLTEAEKEVKRLRNIEKLYQEMRKESTEIANENRALKFEIDNKNKEIQELLNRIH